MLCSAILQLQTMENEQVQQTQPSKTQIAESQSGGSHSQSDSSSHKSEQQIPKSDEGDKKSQQEDQKGSQSKEEMNLYAAEELHSSESANSHHKVQSEEAMQSSGDECQIDTKTDKSGEPCELLAKGTDDYPSSKQVLTIQPYSQGHFEEQGLKIEEHQQQPRESVLVNIKETQAYQYPSLDLQSTHSGEPTVARILQYRKQHFLKIETQIFTLEVLQPGEEVYLIDRRFSDFSFVHQAIVCNHLGYILHPFPDKSVESFLSLKLSLGDEGHKHQLIEKRMYELEKFINFVLSHEELRNCEEIWIFLCRDREDYDKGRKRIEKYLDEYHELENYSQIKKVIEQGVSFVQAFLAKDAANDKKNTYLLSKMDIQFGLYLQKMQQYEADMGKMAELMQQLLEVQQEFSVFTDIDTDIDALLKLCAKMTSGKEYAKTMRKWIEHELMDLLLHHIHQIKQVITQLIHRMHLSQLTIDLSQEADKERCEKIKRRIERFQRNFLRSWDPYISNLAQQYARYKDEFHAQWQKHSALMLKIWHKQEI